MKKQSQTNKNKKKLPPPYHNNPDVAIHNVKKSMRPQVDGPTVDNFSSIDSTDSLAHSGIIETKAKSQRTKRPTKEKTRLLNISNDATIAIVFTILSTITGIVIYNHSNHFVSVDKDIDYLKDKDKEHKSLIEKNADKTNDLDKNVDLLKQKIEIDQKKK